VLAQLQDNAGLPLGELAERIGMSQAWCARRIRSLEQAGWIAGYAAVVEAGLAAPDVMVFVHIQFDWHVKQRLEQFERTIMERPEVRECYLLTGETEYLLRVMVPDVAAYERLLVEHLRRLPGLLHLKSGFALSKVLPVTGAAAANRRSMRLRGAPGDNSAVANGGGSR
jgi:DNA-binding Lrp family transcriptional regulator